jgi:predicted nucleic acid-binding protein
VADLLVDTDVFVDHIRGVRPIDPGRDRIRYSVITRCELFAGPQEQEEIVRELLSPFDEVEVSGETAELAGRIRRTTGILTPDALIAATAINNGFALLTRNVRDFRRVKGLRLASARR